MSASPLAREMFKNNAGPPPPRRSLSSSMRELPPAFTQDMGELLTTMTRAISASADRFRAFDGARPATFTPEHQHLIPEPGATFLVAIGLHTTHVMLVVSAAREKASKRVLCFDAALYEDGRINSDELFRFVPNAHCAGGWTLASEGLGGGAWHIKPLPHC